MRYILAIFLLIVGCSEKKMHNQETKPKIKKTKAISENIKTIEGLEFNKTKLIFPKERVVLLFDNNSTLCQIQKNILKKLNINFKDTNNEFLKNYFKIKLYPTIVVIENNKTIKYENFTPLEILKAEGF